MLLTHKLVISAKFHKDRPKNLDFLLILCFWASLDFFASVYSSICTLLITFDDILKLVKQEIKKNWWRCVTVQNSYTLIWLALKVVLKVQLSISKVFFGNLTTDFGLITCKKCISRISWVWHSIIFQEQTKKKSYTVNNPNLSIMLFASKLLIVTLFGFLILWHFLIPNILQPHPDIVSDV